MKTIFESQAEFLQAGDVKFPEKNLTLAESLVIEETAEWMAEEAHSHDALKEMCDLMYVCAQYMNQSVGPVKAQKLFDAVHKNNMGKCIDGKLVKNEAGKILKPEGFDKLGWKQDFIDILGEE